LRRPLFLVGLVVLALGAGAGVLFAQTELPEIAELTQSTYVCAADVAAGECTAQNAMAKVQGDEGDRYNIPVDEMPDALVNAVISVEDRDFFEHRGVDPFGIARALYRDARGASFRQGGSTITQQYVKTAFDLTREKSITRKINEAVLSIKLEREMSKEEILEGYLNTIYFGRGAYGVGAASQAYFGIDVRDPSFGIDEGAFLAGLIRAPNLAEPSKYPEEAARRRHTALVAMEEEGYITAPEREYAGAVALAEPYIKPFGSIKLVDTRRGADIGTPYVTDYVQGELLRLGFTERAITGGGLRVYTSLDYDMQRAAWEAVVSTLDLEEDPEASLVAVDDQGLVRAMVGSRHPYTPAREGVRGYQANYAVRGHGSDGREPGSTFKPVVLAEAIRRNYSLESRYDAPGTIEIPHEVCPNQGEPWEVSNYSESDAGVLDLVDATRESSNTAFAQLMADLQPDGVAQLANELGIGGEEGVGPPVCAMVLGTVNATPLEMAGMYSTFANRGVYKQPDVITRVEQVDQDGEATVVYERQVSEKQVLTPEQADKVTHALQSVLQPGGTAADNAIGKDAAGKTGTSQENRNAWFAGYVPRLTAVVWMGYPDADFLNPETGKNELWPMNEKGRLVHGIAATGGSFPAEIWQKFMLLATGNMDDEFVELSRDQIDSGTVLNEGELFTRDETTTTRPRFTPPDLSIPRPGGGGPGGGGGGGGGGGQSTTTTTEGDDTTTTTEPTPTSGTTETTRPRPVPDDE
jgi:penicillin-binding protein 1A